jgi:hypothetical protein
LELVDKIVKGDRTKWDTILQMPLIEFLNTIAFYKAKTKETAETIRAVSNKGIQRICGGVFERDVVTNYRQYLLQIAKI